MGGHVLRLIADGSRVFIASTLDLVSERRVASEELVGLGLIPVTIDQAAGTPEEIRRMCEKAASNCDCVLILCGQEYGPITVAELSAAHGARVPLITFVQTPGRALEPTVKVLLDTLEEIGIMHAFDHLSDLRRLVRYFFGAELTTEQVQLYCRLLAKSEGPEILPPW